MVCLDTDFIIDYTRERKKNKVGPAILKFKELSERNETPKTTIVNVSELYHGANNIGTKLAIQRIENIISKFEILNYTTETAKEFGRIASYLQKIGKQIGFADVLIASIVIENNETIITRNVEHFKNIPELKIMTY